MGTFDLRVYNVQVGYTAVSWIQIHPILNGSGPEVLLIMQKQKQNCKINLIKNAKVTTETHKS
jgi:hypothetical protein